MAKSKRKRKRRGKAGLVKVRGYTQLAAELKRHADSIEAMVESFGAKRTVLSLVSSNSLAGIASAVSDLRAVATYAEDEDEYDEDEEDEEPSD